MASKSRPRRSTANLKSSSPYGSSQSYRSNGGSDADYRLHPTPLPTSTLADIGSRLGAFWTASGSSTSHVPPSQTQAKDKGQPDSSEDEVESSDESLDEAPPTTTERDQRDMRAISDELKADKDSEGTSPSKVYPPLPNFKPTILVASPNGVVARERPSTVSSQPEAPPKISASLPSPSWATSQIPSPIPATMASAAPVASTSASALTVEQKRRVEENRQKALAAKAQREQQLKHQRDKTSVQIKEERALKARAFGQASLESFGVAFKSNRVPRKDFRVPVKKDAESLKKQEARRQQYLELREQVTEQQRKEMETPPEPYTPDPRCSPEQLQILDAVRASKNVFFTGSAGVGKSFLLQELVRMLEHDRRETAVCAPTGIAAVNVDGKTFHSWAKVGLGNGSVHDLYNRVMGSQKKQEREAKRDGRKPPPDLAIVTTSVLIIDEISMLDPNLFERVSLVCKAIRHDPRPFGGMQVILSGDFFQLPPVLKDDDATCPYCGSPGIQRDSKAGTIKCIPPINKKFEAVPCGRIRKEYKYCFETATWAELKLSVIELSRVFRQSDLTFITALNKVRRGTVDEETDALFNTRSAPLAEHSIFPTNLYPKKKDVNTENTKQFSLLDDEPSAFEANDVVSGPYAQAFASKLDKDVQAAKSFDLKVGAQVLLLVNMDMTAGLVNGSRGVVIDFHDVGDPEGHPEAMHGVVRAARDRDEAWRKSAEDAWQEKQKHKALPVVLFANGATVIVHPNTWTIEIDRDNYLSRTQLPLTLAWAITCHKSQGQSLDRLIVHLMSVWENGQAYVALSRARTLEGLQVLGWSRNVVRADPLVSDFYQCIADGKTCGHPDESLLRIQDFFPADIVRLLLPHANWRPPARLLKTSLSKQVTFVESYNRSMKVAPTGSGAAAIESQAGNSSLHGIMPGSLVSASPSNSSFLNSQSTGSSILHGLPTPLSEMPQNVDGALKIYHQRLATLLSDLIGAIKGQPFDIDSIRRHTLDAIAQAFDSARPVKFEAEVKMEDVVKTEPLSQILPASGDVERKGRKREHKRRKKHKDSQASQA